MCDIEFDASIAGEKPALFPYGIRGMRKNAFSIVKDDLKHKITQAASELRNAVETMDIDKANQRAGVLDDTVKHVLDIEDRMVLAYADLERKNDKLADENRRMSQDYCELREKYNALDRKYNNLKTGNQGIEARSRISTIAHLACYRAIELETSPLSCLR